MVGSEYHGGTGTEGIVSSSFIVALVSAASCVASRLLILVVRGDGGRPRLTVLEVLKENAKVTTDVLALLVLVVLAKRRDNKRSAATLDGHGQQQRGAMLFRVFPTNTQSDAVKE